MASPRTCTLALLRAIAAVTCSFVTAWRRRTP